MIVIGIILVVFGLVIVFLLEHDILDIPYLLEELLPFIAVISVILGLVMTFFYLFQTLVSAIPPEDIKSMEYYTNVQSEQSSCSLLGHSCIVEEWSPICLIQECIIDTRK